MTDTNRYVVRKAMPRHLMGKNIPYNLYEGESGVTSNPHEATHLTYEEAEQAMRKIPTSILRYCSIISVDQAIEEYNPNDPVILSVDELNE